MMLVTTSRKPGQLTRSVARALSQILGGRFQNRGKSGFEEMAAMAERHGLSRILFVWEKNGNPDRLVFFDLEKAAELGEDDNADKNPWLKPELQVSGVVFPRVPFRKQGCTLKTEGQDGLKIGKLFLASEGENQMVISGKTLKAYNEKRLILELRIRPVS